MSSESQAQSPRRKRKPQVFKRTMRQVIRDLLILTVFFLILGRYFSASQPDFSRLSVERNAYAEKGEGDIRLAIVWDAYEYNKGFLQGVELAVKEVNDAGGLLGRKLVYDVYPDSPSTPRKVAQNIEYAAVIGHETSDKAKPASIAYSYSQLLYFAPTATHPDLTRSDFPLVIRTVPDDRGMVGALVDEMVRASVTNVAIVGVRNDYGISMSILLEELCGNTDITTFNAGTYSEGQRDFRRLTYRLKENPLDAIFLADTLPRAGTVITQLREQNLHVPVLGGDGLDSAPDLWEGAPDGAANKVYLASVYEPPAGATHEEVISRARSQAEKVFLQGYLSDYDDSPGIYSIAGYDAVKLYVQAVNRTKTTVPLLVSSTLKYEGPWLTVSGECSFTEIGDVVGRQLIIKEMRDGRFITKTEGQECLLSLQ